MKKLQQSQKKAEGGDAMRRLGEFEFHQYESAQFRLLRLCESQAFEIKTAYADVHPTRVGVDYSLGRIISESASVEEHAIYIADLKAEHKRQRDYWQARATAFREATSLLDGEQRVIYNNPSQASYQQVKAVKNQLRELLQTVIARTPGLQRRKTNRYQEAAEFVDVEEWDRLVDNMPDSALLKDYWDMDEVTL